MERDSGSFEDYKRGKAMSITRQEREEFERDIKTSNYSEALHVGKELEQIENLLEINKYQKECKGVVIDVYDVLKAFNVVNPATQHALKKLLAGGKRGYKSVEQDYREAIQSIERAIELEE